MKRALRFWALLSCALALPAVAQSSGSAQLLVSMAVQPSISLVFNDSTSVGTTGFCSLTNAGTNNVNLDFGQASFTGGDSLPCVAFSTTASDYTVSSGFDVVVTKANSSSASYQLAAKISAAPPASVVWMVNGTPMTTTFASLSATNPYGSRIGQTVSIQVKKNVGAQTLSETITFLATAN